MRAPRPKIPTSLLIIDAIGTVLAGLGLAGLLTDVSGVFPFLADKNSCRGRRRHRLRAGHVRARHISSAGRRWCAPRRPLSRTSPDTLSRNILCQSVRPDPSTPGRCAPYAQDERIRARSARSRRIKAVRSCAA